MFLYKTEIPGRPILVQIQKERVFACHATRSPCGAVDMLLVAPAARVQRILELAVGIKSNSSPGLDVLCIALAPLTTPPRAWPAGSRSDPPNEWPQWQDQGMNCSPEAPPSSC